MSIDQAGKHTQGAYIIPILFDNSHGNAILKAMFSTGDLEEKLREQKRFIEENDSKRRASVRGLPYLDLINSKIPIEIKALQIITEGEARAAKLAPIDIVKTKLLVVAFDPEKEEAKEIIERLKKTHEVNIAIVSEKSLDHAWSFYQYVQQAKEISGRVEINENKLKELQSRITSIASLTEQVSTFDSPYTSQILELILAGAMALRASDIHLEPTQTAGLFRLRIDGALNIIFDKFPLHIYKSIITRIKLLSSLKLNITNQPQDGRFTIRLHDRDIEMRTSVIPSEYGETVVMRILDPLAIKTELEALGWRKDDLEIAKANIRKPNGLVLNTGPTGSGKTTTLYAFMRSIVRPEIKIITVEDPIEYHLLGVTQTQIDSTAGYTFASGLRSILRQDPNVILVGEIRDSETAEIAVNAALTGHMVLSTLHTNDSIGAIPRLIDLGAKTATLGPALTLIMAQRLVRVLCPKCKKGNPFTPEQKAKVAEFIAGLPARVDKNDYKDLDMHYTPVGCPECANIGYKGRVSIFELLQVDEAIEKAIYANANEIEIKEIAKKQGIVMMQEDGILKILSGTTSLEEVEKKTGQITWLPR